MSDTAKPLAPRKPWTVPMLGEARAIHAGGGNGSITFTFTATPAASTTTAVPTLGEWSRLLLTGLLALGAGVLLRRRS